MGDFYELFFEDAHIASKALDIVLSNRGKKQNRDIPMCGVPVISSDGYIQTLIRKGFRVAICEQTEAASEARRRGPKSVVAREVVRVLTPGTLTEESLLDARSHNFLASIALVRGDAAIAWTDISVGQFQVTPCSLKNLAIHLAQVSPNEVLYSESAEPAIHDLIKTCETTAMPLASVHFDSRNANRQLCKLFEVHTLEAFGEFSRPELGALGAIVSYLELTQKGSQSLLLPPKRVRPEDTVQIDSTTRRNLEISKDFSGNRKASLLGSIDRTLTAAGARLLEQRISAPSTELEEIIIRQKAISCFMDMKDLRLEVRKLLRGLPDLNRSLSRLVINRGAPRDLSALRKGLRQAKSICELMNSKENSESDEPNTVSRIIGMDIDLSPLKQSRNKLTGFETLLELLESSVVDEPPVFLKDGGVIKEGYCNELDEERHLRDQGRQHIASMQADFVADTNIESLKIKHNNVLGYFIEIPKTQSEILLTPPKSEKYIHRHTVSNALRFTTEELSKAESRLLNAASRALEIEKRIFNVLREHVLQAANSITEVTEGLAEIDFSSALSELAEELDWRRPIIQEDGILEIVGGRHPVVEQSLREGSNQQFVANDCFLADTDKSPRIRLITGPNMAGKSTYLRQNALIVLLAQSGSFVPAESARIGLVSQIFSRVGASDELAKGRSTFMVEMVETAAILNQAQSNALVILDEIGRGTATYDGLSIAWATLEHLHQINRCRALFATHYHELTHLTVKLPRIVNSTVSVREWENEIIFLYDVQDGAAERSYGVQVAKLAGMPESAVTRAQEILDCLESDERDSTGKTASLIEELPLFAEDRKAQHSQIIYKPSPLKNRVSQINPDEISPLDALNLIYELKSISEDT